MPPRRGDGSGSRRRTIGSKGIGGVKVAVLDTGFAGMESGGPYLPASAEVVEHYDPDFVRRFPSLGDPVVPQGA